MRAIKHLDAGEYREHVTSQMISGRYVGPLGRRELKKHVTALAFLTGISSRQIELDIYRDAKRAWDSAES